MPYHIITDKLVASKLIYFPRLNISPSVIVRSNINRLFTYWYTLVSFCLIECAFSSRTFRRIILWRATSIMHQHANADIIGMIILNLEVIDLDGRFQKLMLNFFNDDILAVDEDENISRTEMRRACPAVYGV